MVGLVGDGEEERLVVRVRSVSIFTNKENGISRFADEDSKLDQLQSPVRHLLHRLGALSSGIVFHRVSFPNSFKPCNIFMCLT